MRSGVPQGLPQPSSAPHGLPVQVGVHAGGGAGQTPAANMQGSAQATWPGAGTVQAGQQAFPTSTSPAGQHAGGAPPSGAGAGAGQGSVHPG